MGEMVVSGYKAPSIKLTKEGSPVLCGSRNDPSCLPITKTLQVLLTCPWMKYPCRIGTDSQVFLWKAKHHFLQRSLYLKTFPVAYAFKSLPLKSGGFSQVGLRQLLFHLERCCLWEGHWDLLHVPWWVLWSDKILITVSRGRALCWIGWYFL